MTGTITFNGKPLPNLVVRFQPVGTGVTGQLEAGMGSYGETDALGRYALRFSDNDARGALVGEHTIMISERVSEAAEADAGGIGEEPKSDIPSKWSDGSQRYVVKDGDNAANFELSQ